MKKSLIAICIYLFVIGCGNQKEEQAHEHDKQEGLSFTLYSDKTEIFVEFQPLIVGREARFAAHFTVLGESFKPLTSGAVTVSLVVNNKAIGQSSDKPSAPGIYLLNLLPATAGKGDLIFDITTKDFTDKHVIKDVTVYADEHAAEQAQPSAENNGSEIAFLKEQAWKIDFANMVVGNAPFSDVIRTSGLIRSAPGEEAIITANTSGIVQIESNGIVPGSPVKSGQPLFTIVGGNLTNGNIELRYREAEATYKKAKSDYERAEKLIADKIISQQDFERTKFSYEQARINYESLQRNYTGNGLRVTSPIDGFLNVINITEGQYVEDGAALASVAKNKEMFLQANVSQRYYNELSRVTSANFKVPGSDTVYDTQMMKGKLLAYGRGTTSSSTFLPVTFQFQNPGTLIPGTPVEVFLKTTSGKNSIVIPKTALIEEQGSFYVFVQNTGESFEKRQVTVGTTDGISVQVIQGLNVGERVVTKGAYQVKLSNASGKVPEHSHE